MSSAKRSSSPQGDSPVAKKKRVTAKSLGLTQEESNRIKAAPIKKKLKGIVRKLCRQVDEDWHDGWEEQFETKMGWLYAIQEPLQAVLDIGVGKGKALKECNEVLKIVSDSLYDLLAVNCRVNTMNEFGDSDEKIELDLPWGGEFSCRADNPIEAWSYVWVALLRTHATNGEAKEALLLRCIKDASDNMEGAEYMKLPGFLYDKNDEDFDEWALEEGDGVDGENVPDGAALGLLMERKASQWKNLSTTKKTHRMRGFVDRRFDSPSCYSP